MINLLKIIAIKDFHYYDINHRKEEIYLSGHLKCRKLIRGWVELEYSGISI